jgi:hypothetical protein
MTWQCHRGEFASHDSQIENFHMMLGVLKVIKGYRRGIDHTALAITTNQGNLHGVLIVNL